MAPVQPNSAVPWSAPTDELARRERLRIQDGKPLLPPPGLEGLAQGSNLVSHRVQEALTIWASTVQHLRAQPSDVAAAERLIFLVLMLANAAATSGDYSSLRGQLESSLEVMTLPRHRQMLRAMITRRAALEGDLRAAEGWLAGCDPYSEDLEMDSQYRVSRALIDTAYGRSDAVLVTLGADAEQVPIQDALDPFAVVLRAHAYERRGDLAAAASQLQAVLQQGNSQTISSVIQALPASWRICAQALPLARAGRRQKLAQTAGFGDLFVGTILMGVTLVIVGGGVVEAILDGDAASLVLPVIFFLAFGGWGFSSLRKGFR